ncbi:MAG: hypothetical protein WD533_02790, partial [Dehalococcoidia bacterium]
MVPADNPSAIVVPMHSGIPSSRALVIAPTARELGGLTSDGHRRAATVGIGRAAADALAALLRDEVPSFVLSLGFAGALAPDLPTGGLTLHTQLCVPEALLPPIHQQAGPLNEKAVALLTAARLPFHSGPLLTVQRPLLTPAEKRMQYAASGAIAVDMEGYWLAQAATDAGVPMLTIRAVLDEAEHTLPPMVESIITDGGRNEWRAALRAIFTT